MQFSQSVSVNVPVGVVNGNVLVAAHLCWFQPIVPSGWTPALALTWVRQGYQCYFHVYYRVANNEPSSYAFETSGSDENMVCISAWSGVDTTTPLDVQPLGQINGASMHMTAPSLTTITHGCNLLFIGAVMDSSVQDTTVIPPTAFSQLLYYNISWTGAYLAQRSQATAGETGSATATLNISQHNGTMLLALRPANYSHMTTMRGVW